MKLGGHQTFHLRESWLHKGMASLVNDHRIFQDAMASSRLGVGKNMVEAMRYWLQACQLVKIDDEYSLSKVGSKIYEADPFFELDGTVLLLHYLLATNERQATAWHWFFNKFGATDFDIDGVQVYLTTYLANTLKKNSSPNVIRREIQCLLKMYTDVEYRIRETPETENPSPFCRFKSIQKDGEKYRKVGFDVNLIDPLIYSYCLYLFWIMTERPATISFENICKQPGSPGVIFGLSSDSNIYILELAKEIDSAPIAISRSGGYFSISIDEEKAAKTLDFYYDKYSDLLQESRWL
ncbi:MAG: DUF4007 family protein [Oligoflexus sp.]